MMTTEQCFFEMYKMDYQFGWYDKNQMRSLVVQGFLSADGFKQIVGEDYAPQTSETTQA